MKTLGRLHLLNGGHIDILIADRLPLPEGKIYTVICKDKVCSGTDFTEDHINHYTCECCGLEQTFY